MAQGFRGRMVIALSLVAGVAAVACSSDPLDPPVAATFQVESVGEGDPILMMTQSVVPTAVMDAYFEGLIEVDEAGCLRLDGGGGATVVWPLGYTGVATTEGVAILDTDGAGVGHVGGTFSFGGGMVPELLATLGFTQADRNLAGSLCPGNYWIVAP